MLSNIVKSKIIVFNPEQDLPKYTLNDSEVEHVCSTKYLRAK